MDATSSGTVGLQKRLSLVAAEIAAIGRELDAAIPAPSKCPPRREEGEQADLDELLVAIARRIIRARELGSQKLRPGLFSDPAWDMLLDLFVARLTGRRICVSSLCIASRAPATTALRGIKDMVVHGEIVRFADPSDKRRAYIEISGPTFEALRDTLLAAEGRPARCGGSSS